LPTCQSHLPTLYSNPVHATLRSFFLPGPAGQLEALLNAGVPDATHAALVCHPHPLYGGTLHNKVVFHAMKALNALGLPVLRFNFRGAGLSHGEHDHGAGELDDVRTALDFLDHEFQLPLIFAGFSFGAAVGLRAACPDPRVQVLIALGTPITPIDDRTYDYDFLRTCTKPKLFVSGARDQFASKEKLEALVAPLPEPKKLVIIEAADHFFEGRLREMREAVEGWARENVRA
jgi:alpha/beta superfamily hydrolase